MINFLLDSSCWSSVTQLEYLNYITKLLADESTIPIKLIRIRYPQRHVNRRFWSGVLNDTPTTPPPRHTLDQKASNVSCDWPCLMNSGDDVVSVEPTSDQPSRYWKLFKCREKRHCNLTIQFKSMAFWFTCSCLQHCQCCWDSKFANSQHFL